MSGIGGVILVLAILIFVPAIIRALWRRMSGKTGADSAPQPEAPSAPDTPLFPGTISGTISGTSGIYDVVERLNAFFQVVSHPEDLAANADFQEGVAMLRDPAVSEQELIGHATGENAITSALAIEAMRQRTDSAETRHAVLGCIGTIAAWPQYFGLKFLASTTPPEEPVIGRVLASCTNYMNYRLSKLFLEAFVRERRDAGEPLSMGNAPPGWTTMPATGSTSFSGTWTRSWASP